MTEIDYENGYDTFGKKCVAHVLEIYSRSWLDDEAKRRIALAYIRGIEEAMSLEVKFDNTAIEIAMAKFRTRTSSKKRLA